MKSDFLARIEKLSHEEMGKIRGGKEKPHPDDDILIIRKKKVF